MSTCQCQRSRVAVVHNGVRALSRGTFERTSDFGRGMFERTDNFGGFFSSIGAGLGWIGSNVLAPLLPAGLQLGAAVATRAVMGGSQQPAPTQTSQQSPLQTAVQQEQQRSVTSGLDSKYLILGAIVLGGLFIYSQRRR